MVDFELFRPELDAALGRSDRAKGGRPPYDPVLMFRILVLQSLYTLSDDQAEYQVRDRLSFMRFAGLALHEPVPDAKTTWLFREQLVRAGAFERLFARFDAALAERGYLAMGGQIVDATIVEARRPRLTQDRPPPTATEAAHPHRTIRPDRPSPPSLPQREGIIPNRPAPRVFRGVQLVHKPGWFPLPVAARCSNYSAAIAERGE